MTKVNNEINNNRYTKLLSLLYKCKKIINFGDIGIKNIKLNRNNKVIPKSNANVAKEYKIFKNMVKNIDFSVLLFFINYMYDIYKIKQTARVKLNFKEKGSTSRRVDTVCYRNMRLCYLGDPVGPLFEPLLSWLENLRLTYLKEEQENVLF